MSSLFSNIIHNFLIAFGVVIGASAFNGLGAIITNQPPLKTMVDTANSTKIWAMMVAMGDTFFSFSMIEKGLLEGEFRSLIKQGIYVLIALLGANMGYGFIRLIQRCSQIWGS